MSCHKRWNATDCTVLEINAVPFGIVDRGQAAVGMTEDERINFPCFNKAMRGLYVGICTFDISDIHVS